MFHVEIIEYKTNRTVKRIGEFPTEKMAEKCCAGIDINLDHERFYSVTCDSN